MKNVLTTLMVMLCITTASLAQSSNSNQPIEVKAKIAAQQAGCLSGYNGQIDAQVTVISSCFAGGFVTEVLLVPVCHGPNCANIKLAPLAKVTFYCTDDVGTVECL